MSELRKEEDEEPLPVETRRVISVIPDVSQQVSSRASAALHGAPAGRDATIEDERLIVDRTKRGSKIKWRDRF